MAVTVRAATPDDVPGIQRVARRGWSGVYGDFLDDVTIERAMDEWYATESVRAAIERDDVAYFVATDRDAVVGYVNASRGEGNRGTIGTFYVDPARWNEGIGTRLFEHALDALRERGVTRIRIEVFERNAVGRAVYESWGFAVVKRDDESLFGETASVVTYAGDI